MVNRSDYEMAVGSPGKFEGEAPYVPYFWEKMLDGCEDDDDGFVVTFEVTPGDIAIFPELKEGAFIYLAEGDNGFVTEVSEPNYERDF